MQKEKLYKGLPYINDKKLFAAVMFAKKMIKDGTPPGLANYKAANYYGYDTSEVAHYIGIYANSRGKTARKKDKLKTFYCVKRVWNDDYYGTISAMIDQEKDAYTKPSDWNDDNSFHAVDYIWFDSKEKALEYIFKQQYWGEMKIEVIENEGWHVTNEIDTEPKTPFSLFLKLMKEGAING